MRNNKFFSPATMGRLIKIIFIFLGILLSSAQIMAQENPNKEIKANSSAYTGDFYITFLDGNDKFMITKLRITPGSYNEWHIHPDACQTMFVIEGNGYYQEEGKAVMLLKPGDSVTTPANTKHWNGSTPNESVTVITITEVNDKPHVEWLGKIDPSLFSTNQN